MDPTDRPEAYGVFKPVGHVIMAFATDADTQGALSALLSSGFARDEVAVIHPSRWKAKPKPTSRRLAFWRRLDKN